MLATCTELVPNLSGVQTTGYYYMDEWKAEMPQPQDTGCSHIRSTSFISAAMAGTLSLDHEDKIRYEKITKT